MVESKRACESLTSRQNEYVPRGETAQVDLSAGAAGLRRPPAFIRSILAIFFKTLRQSRGGALAVSVLLLSLRPLLPLVLAPPDVERASFNTMALASVVYLRVAARDKKFRQDGEA
jgi:hypothetical protein